MEIKLCRVTKETAKFSPSTELKFTVKSEEIELEYVIGMITTDLEDKLDEGDESAPLSTVELGIWDGCCFVWNVEKYNKFLEALRDTESGDARFMQNGGCGGYIGFHANKGKLYIYANHMGNGITKLALPSSSADYYDEFAKLPQLIVEAVERVKDWYRNYG